MTTYFDYILPELFSHIVPHLDNYDDYYNFIKILGSTLSYETYLTFQHEQKVANLIIYEIFSPNVYQKLMNFYHKPIHVESNVPKLLKYEELVHGIPKIRYSKSGFKREGEYKVTEFKDVANDYDDLCNFASTDYIRRVAQEEFKVELPTDRQELCQRIFSITRHKELSEELPKIREEFLLYPGTKEDPRVQYKKYMVDPTQWSLGESRIDIEEYLTEIKDICVDSNKTSRDAYQLALDIGIQRYVDRNQNKNEICKVIENYLNVVREERIL